MAKRHSDALAISDGASNPSGIAHSIVDACKEIRAEPGHTGTDQLRQDPALRLMVHQLAFLMGIPEVAMSTANDGTDWFEWRKLCETKKGEVFVCKTCGSSACVCTCSTPRFEKAGP